MAKGLQDKPQVTLDRAAREPRTWADPKSARRSAAQETQHYDIDPTKRAAIVGSVNDAFDAPRTNRMPPGQDIGDQVQSRQNAQPYSNAGATDESNSVNAAMLLKGYQRQPMSPEDELYSSEHIDLFYGEAEVDGKTGFVERNNYLDRN